MNKNNNITWRDWLFIVWMVFSFIWLVRFTTEQANPVQYLLTYPEPQYIVHVIFQNTSLYFTDGSHFCESVADWEDGYYFHSGDIVTIASSRNEFSGECENILYHFQIPTEEESQCLILLNDWQLLRGPCFIVHGGG